MLTLRPSHPTCIPAPFPTRAAEGGARRRGAASEDDDSGGVFSSLIGAKAGALSSSAAAAAAAALRYANGQMQAIITGNNYTKNGKYFQIAIHCRRYKTTQNHV